ncbi:nuclear transport factor 2 family protein [Streptomyces sp. MZ04]|uniref:nuclear transport factor 2 family protein n=1 Tax=Streptomyces sp. MZ04 TaxID=2559236 RepID=UPI00107E9E37|nr:nuclear transport factor 2 family protein [Streptomyces sp. MZ04]TGA86536.1 nuclear transport factor 2 family protein [Streptomyces sp. MZ04]
MNTQPTASETDPVAVLTAMYEAEGRYLAAGGPGQASFDLLAPYFAPDVVLHQADALPYGGTWRGHAGMVRFFLAMAEAWESFEIGEQEFLAAGDKVVVHSQVVARARATGRELAFPVLQTIAVRSGRIAEVWPFYWDTAAIAAATGGRDYSARPETIRPSLDSAKTAPPR